MDKILVTVMMLVNGSIQSVTNTIDSFRQSPVFPDSVDHPDNAVFVGHAVCYHAIDEEAKRFVCHTLGDARPLCAHPYDSSVWLDALDVLDHEITADLSARTGVPENEQD